MHRQHKDSLLLVRKCAFDVKGSSTTIVPYDGMAQDETKDYYVELCFKNGDRETVPKFLLPTLNALYIANEPPAKIKTNVSASFFQDKPVAFLRKDGSIVKGKMFLTS